MTDLEKIQKILTHPGYKVVLGECKDIGTPLLVYKTTYNVTNCVVITPFLYSSNYDESMSVLCGDGLYQLYRITIKILETFDV